MTVAVVFAIGAAMATMKMPVACAQQPLYYKSGDQYLPAGIEGEDFVCAWDHFSSNCTYYFDPNTQTYRVCKAGKILWLR